MKLEISSFTEPGVFANERLILNVISDIDIGDYVVFCSAASVAKKPISGRKTAYWFPDREVKAGDLVVLYTKKGSSSKKDLSGGRTAHFFYWGLDTSIWSGSGNVAVILRVAEWIYKIAGESE